MQTTALVHTAIIIVGLAVTATIAAAGSSKEPSSHYEQREPSGSGTGKFYMGREIAGVMSHTRMYRLDRPEREKEERSDLLIKALPLAAADVVADIGAGVGYFSFPVAERVPDGAVLAVDIQQEMLDELERRKRKQGVDNVQTVLGRIDDTRLDPNSVDLVFIVDSYHEFSHPREMGESIFAALRKGGQLIIVEDRAEDTSRAWGRLHKMSEDQARKEITALGFEWIRTDDFLPQQHFLVFRKPAAD